MNFIQLFSLLLIYYQYVNNTARGVKIEQSAGYKFNFISTCITTIVQHIVTMKEEKKKESETSKRRRKE